MSKFNYSLRKEISFILAIKLMLIFILWVLFFQHPVEEHLSNQDIEQHIVSS